MQKSHNWETLSQGAAKTGLQPTEGLLWTFAALLDQATLVHHTILMSLGNIVCETR